MFLTLLFACSVPASLFPLGDGDDAYTATTDFSGIWLAQKQLTGSEAVEMSDQCQMVAGDRVPSSVKKLAKPQAVGTSCAIKKVEGVVIRADAVGRCTGLSGWNVSYSSTCLRTDGAWVYEAGSNVDTGCACPTGGLAVPDRFDTVIAVLRVGKAGRYRVGGKYLLRDVPRAEQALDPDTWLNLGVIEVGGAVYGDVSVDRVEPYPLSQRHPAGRRLRA